jgi:protoporphyrin/coproporphyrin ferrochelatase
MNIDVILITYGEPPRPRFLDQWVYSNTILTKLTRLVAPIPHFVIPFLGAYRGYTRVKTWKEARFTSPLEGYTFKQAKALSIRLNQQAPQHKWQMHVAYEFRTPTLHDMLNQVCKTDCERILLIPLYVPVSDFTTGISMRDFDQYKTKKPGILPETHFITFRDALDDLAKVMVDHLRISLQKKDLSPKQIKEAGLLCGCHGTVIHPPKGITDTGYTDTFHLYQKVEHHLKSEFAHIAIGWLNHRLGGDWTTPTLETSAQEMRDKGIENIIYFPFGFLADNAESQLEGKTVLEELGIHNFHHILCLNDEPNFIQLVSDLAIQQIQDTLSS